MSAYMITFLVLLFSISFDSNANEETPQAPSTVKLIADEWCPYTCKDSVKDKGLMVDVATAAFKAVGMEVTYKSSSWSRAIREVDNGGHDALLGADAARRPYYYFTEDFFMNEETAFVILRGSDVTLDKPSDLLNYKIGLMRSYTYADNSVWQSIIYGHTNTMQLSGAYGEVRLLELLAKKRIEIALMNIDVAKYYIRNHPEMKNVKYIRKGLKSKLVIGFSPNERGKALSSKFHQGYQRIKSTDKLKAIYEKYGIEMPS